jgi:hypothetical protein
VYARAVQAGILDPAICACGAGLALGWDGVLGGWAVMLGACVQGDATFGSRVKRRTTGRRPRKESAKRLLLASAPFRSPAPDPRALSVSLPSGTAQVATLKTGVARVS